MAESHLPEDLNLWPIDCYRILAVSRDVVSLEAKRAYTKLIKIFKPEQFPDQFRRIREAYEQVLRNLEYQNLIKRDMNALSPVEPILSHPLAPTSQSESIPPPVLQGLNETKDVDTEAVPVEPTQANSRHSSHDIDISVVWEQAIQGNYERAYLKLLDMLNVNKNAEIFSLLYWLLTLDCNLDCSRKASDWLIEGIKHTRDEYSLCELLMREVQVDPNLVYSREYELLLLEPVVDNIKQQLYTSRWMNIRNRGDWSRLAADLKTIQTTFARQSLDQWLHLLFIASDSVAWIDKKNKYFYLWDQIASELQENLSWKSNVSYLFEHYDLLALIRKEWLFPQSRLPEMKQLLQLIASGWRNSLVQFQGQLFQILGLVDENPKHWFHFFDRLHTRSYYLFYAFAYIFSCAESLLNTGPESQNETDDEEKFLMIVQRFIAWASARKLRNPMMNILAFCQKESVDPAHIVFILENYEIKGISKKHKKILTELCSNKILSLMYRMHKLLWSQF